MKNILFIFGTRPEAIKLAPVINIFKKDSNNFKTTIAVTAQHREMLDQVLYLFKIKPDYDLNLMSKNQSLESLTSKIMIGIGSLLKETHPDLVFVQGDTTTTMAASLAAFYQKIPVFFSNPATRPRQLKLFFTFIDSSERRWYIIT